MVTVGSVFAGVGGFDLAFERAGAKVLWNCEIDVNCRSVLQRHWPGVPRFKTVRTVTGEGLRAAALTPDVLVGGFPCQDVSVAGARAGLAGERSGLFFEFARLLDEIHPAWTVIENVPGLLSSQRGRDMGTVLGVLADVGYVGAWRVLDAQYFGVAQRRRRVFFVGHLGDRARAAEVLLEPEGGGGDPPARRAAGEVPTGAAAARPAQRGFGINGAGGLRTTDLDTVGAYVVASHDVSPCLQEREGKGQDTEVTRPMAVYRKATKAHHSEDWERWEETDRSDTLTDRDGTAPTTAVVTAAAFSIYPESGQGADLRATEIDTATALTVDAMERSTDRGVRIATATAVRRLTPLECERLQGFPDGWTDGQPDTVRYRQLGNAVAVPVVEWIARRLVARAR